MSLTDEEKAYIREIARECLKETRVVSEAHEARINAIERKVFNGFGASIVMLKWLIGLLYSGVVFFIAKGLLF